MITNHQAHSLSPVHQSTDGLRGNSLSKMSTELDGADAGPRSSNKSACDSLLDGLN
jgi:hypothetical protein